jgi:hypothetical protein
MEEALLCHVPDFEGLVHLQTTEEVEVFLVEKDVRHTDLAKGEDLLKLHIRNFINVNM